MEKSNKIKYWARDGLLAWLNWFTNPFDSQFSQAILAKGDK
jgi:hypothetical protein